VSYIAYSADIVLTLGLSMYLLVFFLGNAAFVGVGIGILCMTLNYFVAIVNMKYQKEVMKLKDERIKKTSEAVHSVKILKMYGWTELFMKFIEEARDKEVQAMQKRILFTGIFICALYLFPKLVSIGTFFVYSAIYHEITLGVVFASINILNIMAVSSLYFIKNRIH
jgi:ABC-type bacteriocin/lantibiotic exporter with double-glycine peptidase domain